jgi:hypothetical protein
MDGVEARFGTEGAGSLSSRAGKCADGGAVGAESSHPPSAKHALRDVVEPALARVLALDAEAQRWDGVLLIAAELQARRESRERGHTSTPPGAVGPTRRRGNLSEMEDAVVAPAASRGERSQGRV